MKKLGLLLILVSLVLVSCVRNKIENVEVIATPEVDYMTINPDSLYMAANQLYQEGSYCEAAKAYEEGLKYDVNNSGSLYNLACCYGLTGDSKKSGKYLKLALQRGFKDYAHILVDTDFDKVRDSKEIQEIFGKI
ncbi:MAG: hypothetical protein JXR56_07620, partial [Candidatus Cloacimonetes bacterium]|nr:hypothetical protein [Candidatus Cloacimonadota bacterium]